MTAVLQTHRSSLYLIFSPKCIPLAEVAQYFLSGKNPELLQLGVSNNLLEATPTLIVPKGIYSDSKQILKGKPTILRFFSRIGEQSLDISQLQGANQIMDQIRCAKPNDQNLLNQLNPKQYLVGSKLCFADLMAWEYLNSSEHSSDYLKRLESVPQLIKAKKTIEIVMNEIPVLDYYKSAVVEQLSKILNLESDTVIANLITPQKEKNKDHGDYALPVPKLKLKGNPVELAKNIASQVIPNKYIASASAQGPFVHFHYTGPELYYKGISQTIKMGSQFGKNCSGFGKFAICEFSSPNIAKPFHAGHLRSTIIGSFIQKLLNLSGWKTVSINYLGDWGKQYGLLAVGFEKYGSVEDLEKDPIRHLYDVYVKINSEASEDETIHDQARAYFKKMEDGDKDAMALWKKFRDLSIVAYKQIYARINVEFDVYSGESQYSLNQMKASLDELNDKGLLKPDAGALIVDLKEHNLGTAVIGKTDGSMLYLSRDIAAATHRQDLYDFDKMFYCVGAAQEHHFRQLFKILELCGKQWVSKCEHIGFGLIKSKDGNMSTRKGTVVFLSDILDHVKEEMHGVMKKNEEKYAHIADPEKVSDIVGISSILIQDMAARRIKDYAFDWARMLSFEGDTGPYLQYAHARMCSIERLNEFKVTPESVDKVDLTLLTEQSAFNLMHLILEFPDIIRDLADNLEPCQLVNYSLRLSHAVSSAVTELWVHGREPPLQQARLVLYSAARVCLGNSLRLLGLEPLERM